ncbi:P-loop containing nucleoside triphosphate hydrolase protein, partial [Artomyces pyxidatus]
MTTHVLDEVRLTLGIDPSKSFHVNLGNDRPNITQEVRRMKSATDYAALDFLVKGATTADDLPRAIVFVDKIEHAHRIMNRLHSLVPALKDSIDLLHARRSELSRKLSVHDFKHERTRIYIATEAAGMGMDIPDITLIVQFGTPKNLSIWIQRAGRAARSPWVQGRAIMLVQESVFQQNYRKNLEPTLREWIETEGCRRDVIDDYFSNPPRKRESNVAATGACCDNCERKETESIDLPEAYGLSSPPQTPTCRRRSQDPLTPSRRVNANGKRPMVDRPERRGGKHLAAVKDAVRRWRVKTRRTMHPYADFTSEGLLPERNLKTIASKRRPQTIEDLKPILRPPWPLLGRYGG